MRFALKLVALMLVLFLLPGLIRAASNPVPYLYHTLNPSSVAPGHGALTLTVSGVGFISGSTINWNGSPRATTFVSSSQLTAAIPASDLLSAQSVPISVVSPAPGGGTSNVVFFNVVTPIVRPLFSVKEVSSALEVQSVGDFNGDGRPDLFSVPGKTSSQYVVSLSNGDGTFTALPAHSLGLPAGFVAQWEAVGDFNGDGKLDVLILGYLNSPPYALIEYLGNGDGTFQAPHILFTGLASGSLTVADFNLDGKLDIFTGCGPTNLQCVMFGNGDGTFTQGPNAFPNAGPFGPFPSSFGAAYGDFNGDGKLDILVASAHVNGANIDFTLDLARGNGDGTFQNPVVVGTFYSCLNGSCNGSTVLGGMAIGDFNHDGKIDVVDYLFGGSQLVFVDGAFQNIGYERVGVFLGNGDGTFQAPSSVFTNQLRTPNSGQPIIADFDGDGNPDVVVADVLLLGKGDGTFSSTSIPVPQLLPLLATNFTSDGRPNLLLHGSLAIQSADFSGSVTPESNSISSGASATFTVNSLPLGTFSGDVDLTVSGLPSGATAIFSPGTILGGSGTSTLTVQTASSIPSGSYTLNITGTSGSLIHSSSVLLSVNVPAADFTGSISRTSGFVTPGGSTFFTVAIQPLFGFSSNVELSVSGLPAGVTSNFTPQQIPAGSGTSNLEIIANSNAPTGSFPFTLTATGGGVTHSISVPFAVTNSAPTDFSGSIAPLSRATAAGASTSYTISVQPLYGSSANVTLSISGLPVGASASFTPAVIPGSSGSSTLTVSTSSLTPPGTYKLLITGTAGSVSHTGGVDLIVQ